MGHVGTVHLPGMAQGLLARVALGSPPNTERRSDAFGFSKGALEAAFSQQCGGSPPSGSSEPHPPPPRQDRSPGPAWWALPASLPTAQAQTAAGGRCGRPGKGEEPRCWGAWYACWERHSTRPCWKAPGPPRPPPPARRGLTSQRPTADMHTHAHSLTHTHAPSHRDSNGPAGK